MYCPKCGDEMIAGQKSMKCESGEMELAPALFEGLQETFITCSKDPDFKKFTFRVGGAWYCPADATKMTEENGVIGCPNCGKIINSFLFSLIERHPHS